MWYIFLAPRSLDGLTESSYCQETRRTSCSFRDGGFGANPCRQNGSKKLTRIWVHTPILLLQSQSLSDHLFHLCKRAAPMALWMHSVLVPWVLDMGSSCPAVYLFYLVSGIICCVRTSLAGWGLRGDCSNPP